MTISRLLLLTLQFCFVASFGNNNIKTYEVNFPCGSSFISEAIIVQASKIYNEIPELQFAKISVKGSNEEEYSDKVNQVLAKERTAGLIKFYVNAGCNSNDLKVSYGILPQLLIFKPKSKLVSTSILNESFLKDEKQNFEIEASGNGVIKSKNNCIYIFEEKSFESVSGTAVNQGKIKIELVEIKNLSDILLSGILGDLNGLTLSPQLFYKIDAYYKGVKLQLKDYASIQIYLPMQSAERVLDLYQGKLNEDLILWSLNEEGAVYKKELGTEELNTIQNQIGVTLSSDFNSVTPMLYVKTALLDWGMVAYRYKKNDKSFVNIKLNSSEDFSLYLSHENSGIILPIYKNLSYINKYQVEADSKLAGYKIIAIPNNSTDHQYADYSIAGLGENITLELLDCSAGSLKQCLIQK